MKHGKDNSLSNPKESFFTKTITRDKGDVDDDKMARRNALEDVGASVEEDLGQQGGRGRQGEESKEDRNSYREEESKEGRENRTNTEQKEEEKEKEKEEEKDEIEREREEEEGHFTKPTGASSERSSGLPSNGQSAGNILYGKVLSVGNILNGISDKKNLPPDLLHYLKVCYYFFLI